MHILVEHKRTWLSNDAAASFIGYAFTGEIAHYFLTMLDKTKLGLLPPSYKEAASAPVYPQQSSSSSKKRVIEEAFPLLAEENHPKKHIFSLQSPSQLEQTQTPEFSHALLMQKISQLENEKSALSKKELETSIQLGILTYEIDRMKNHEERKHDLLSEKLAAKEQEIGALKTKLEFANEEKINLKVETKTMFDTLDEHLKAALQVSSYLSC